MAQGNRARPVNGTKKLSSVNFPIELIDYLEELSNSTGMNRSALVCIIVKNFKDSNKTIELTVR